MSGNRTARIFVWRALLEGDCKQIHKSEEQLWDELRNRNAWYKQTNKNRWTVVALEEDVPLVMGKRHDWSAEGGCGGVHIHYVCPYCATEEYCDDNPHDESPYLWFCEQGKGVILVETE